MVRFTVRCFIKALKDVAVEPVVFLTFLAINISQVVQQVGGYRVICQHVFANRSDVNCENLRNATVDGESAEILVQKSVSMWTMAFSVASMAPSLVMDVFLGAYGDRHGRKLNMLLGMAGMIVQLFTTIIVYTFPLVVPLYVLVIGALIAGFTGSMMITIISSFAYLADTVLDPTQLTVRLAALGVVMNVASVTGPYIGGVTAQFLTRPQVLVLAEGLVTLSFFYCFCCIRQVPPAELRRRLKEKREKKTGKYEMVKMETTDTSNGTSDGNNGNIEKGKEKESLIKAVIGLLKETVHTFIKKRDGHGRIYLALAFFISFLNVISELGVKFTIFGMYVQKAPLSWNQDTIGYFKSAQAAMTMVSNMAGVMIFKKWFHFNDTFVILICSLSDVGEILVMAFATKTWHVYMSAVIGSFSNLAGPCLQSFLARLVGPDEVGKAYTLFGFTTGIGILISGVVYSPIYYATVGFFPGFVFLFASAILTFRFFVTLWIHVDSNFKKEPAAVGFWKKFMESIFSKEKGSEKDIGRELDIY